MIRYKILDIKRLVIICMRDVVTPDDVIDFIYGLIKDSTYDPAYSTLVDLREAELLYDMQGLKRTLEVMQKTQGFTAERRVVYITSMSSQVVPPMLLNSGRFKAPMKVKVFSTLDTGLKWLGIEGVTVEDYNHLYTEICTE